MTEFRIKLADIPIGVIALYKETKEFCKDYLTNENPAFNIAIGIEDIVKERKHNEVQIAFDGLQQTDFPNEYIETLALYRKITEQLLNFNVLLFHGSVIAKDGMAYIFTAKSGTGKTTHTRLWLENIPGCHVLNGDKPLLLFKEGKIYACGTPWMGKECYGVNEILPVNAICIIERDKVNHINNISLSQAFPVIINQTHKPGDLAKVVRLLKNLDSVKLYSLGCNMEKEAAFVSFNAMVKSNE